jgi:hypothetical protein
VEFCPGYVDEYGIWNNGFTCPKWGGPDEKYCCGAATTRYCCPEPEPIEPPDYDKQWVGEREKGRRRRRNDEEGEEKKMVGKRRRKGGDEKQKILGGVISRGEEKEKPRK